MAIYSIYLDKIGCSMRKPFANGKTGTDQLLDYCAADQHHCFGFTKIQSIYFLNENFLYNCRAMFVSDLVGNPKDVFSHYSGQMIFPGDTSALLQGLAAKL